MKIKVWEEIQFKKATCQDMTIGQVARIVNSHGHDYGKNGSHPDFEIAICPVGTKLTLELMS